MQSKTLYPSQSSGLNQVFVNFELLGAGAAALTIPSTGGGANWVASVTRTSTGLFVVTLKDAWNKCLFKSSDLDDTLNDGGYATVGTLLNEGTSTALSFQLYVRAAAGTVADPAANRRVGVSLCLRNGVQLGGG